jgi:predicted N-acetyltransferase YhbS
MTETTAIEIRPEEPNDHDAVDEVVRAAFLAEFGSTSEVELADSIDLT